jgi:hypothetical protein
MCHAAQWKPAEPPLGVTVLSGLLPEYRAYVGRQMRIIEHWFVLIHFGVMSSSSVMLPLLECIHHRGVNAIYPKNSICQG